MEVFNWRKHRPIEATALLLSGRYVARIYRDQSPMIEAIDGTFVREAKRTDIVEIRRHLLIVERGPNQKVWGTKVAKHEYRKFHNVS